MTINDTVYVLDSDVLIGSHRNQYQHTFAMCFWHWLVEGAKQGLFRSPSNVKTELKGGWSTDFLYLLAKDPEYDSLWIDTNSVAIVSVYGEIQNWAMNIWPKGRGKDQVAIQKALTDFAGEIADPWVVATAVNLQKNENIKAIIVTHETSGGLAPTKIKIPDVAKAQNIDVISLFDLLKKHAENNFTFKR